MCLEEGGGNEYLRKNAWNLSTGSEIMKNSTPLNPSMIVDSTVNM